MRCPACGRGKLFASYLRIPEHCAVCDAELANAASGDGPAVFVILIIGFAVAFAALYTEVKYEPPYWVHAVLWLPAIVGGSLLLLPLVKSLFFASHYHNQVGDGDGDATRPQ